MPLNYIPPANQNAVRSLVVLYSCVCVSVYREDGSTVDSVCRRLSDICILLNRLISDIKEHGDQMQLGGEQITLQLLQERRRAALERYERDFEEQRRRDIANNSQHR